MPRSFSFSAALPVGLAGLCLLAPVARAQSSAFDNQPYTGGLRPDLGGQPRIGDLRPQLQQFFQPTVPLSTTPAFLIQPSIGVDIGVTDNANRLNSPRKADIFTVISPSLVLSGDTSRVKVNLAYSPQYTAYASTPNETQFSQYANGSAIATLIPDAVFVDVRGSITQQSLTGNALNQGATANYNQQNDVQTTSFSITPYAEQRFGGWGSARLGYSFARTLQNLNNGDNNQLVQTTTQQQLATLGTPGYGAIGNLSTQRERASFASGENLGRFNDLSSIQAIQYSGGGSYQNAFRRELDNEVGFALTRQTTLLGGIGYQDVRYAGVPAVRINEPSFNFGVRYTAGPDSTITVLYGRHDAISSISFDGQFAPTARTRVIGSYTTGLTTDIEGSQDVLAATTVGPTGLVTDTATGAPVGVGSGSGVQNGVFRDRRLSLTALLLLERDSYSFSLSSDDRTTATASTSVLGNGIIPAGTSTNSISASLSWSHDLLPGLNSLVSASYAVTNSTSQLLVGTSGSQRTMSLTAALNKQFTETLSGSVRYTFNDQSGGPALNTGLNSGSAFNRGGSFTENILLVGLRKSF